MAALMESISFSTIPSESDILAVTDISVDDEIFISCRRKTLDIYKVSNQKPLKSWSVRHGVTLTSPVVWEDSQQRFITVTNNQDVKLWDKETVDFEKVKKKHSNTKIHQVLVVPEFDTVLLYTNGAVGYLNDIKDSNSKGPLKDAETILWCKAVAVESALCVLYVAQSVKNGSMYMYSHWYYKDSDVWRTSTSDAITAPDSAAVLCTCDSLKNEAEDNVKVYFLWSNGDLNHLCVSQGSIGQFSNVQNISGVHSNSSMVMVDSTHIAVGGVTQNKEDGVCIYDIKFGIQQSWQPYQEKPKQKTKIFCVQNHLFIPCGRTLFAFRYNCRPSTVVSLLGSTRTPEHTDSHPHPVHVTWDVHNKKVKPAMDMTETLANWFTKASNQSGTYPAFKNAFSNLIGELKKIENQHWLVSSHMTKLLQRIFGETKFWPKQEVKQLIAMHAIPLSVIGQLLDCLIQHAEIAMVDQVISTLSNIPEKCLCKTMAFFMQCDEEKLSSALDDAEELSDAPNSTCHLSPQRAFFINKILMLPYSDVFLLECLRSVSFKHALKLLEYLSDLLQTCDTVQDSKNTTKNQGPTLIQVVDWLCLLLDGHMAQFVLSPDSHVTLVKLHTVVMEQVVFFDGLVSLEALLEQFKAKSSIPQDRKVGQYCIEVLHIY